MHCCIPTPTTDSNTSTDMIWVTLNMPSVAEECREMSGNFTLSGEWSPWRGGTAASPLPPARESGGELGSGQSPGHREFFGHLFCCSDNRLPVYYRSRPPDQNFRLPVRGRPQRVGINPQRALPPSFWPRQINHWQPCLRRLSICLSGTLRSTPVP